MPPRGTPRIPADVPPLTASGTLSLLRSRDFLLVVATGGLTSTVRWLELLAIGVFVFDETGSPLLVALMTMLRMLPLAVLGAFAGAFAERVPRKPILVFGLAAMVAVTSVLAALAAADRIALWHLALGSLLGGVFWATDFPVRRTLIGDIAGAARLGGAMSVDVLTNNGSRMIGPALGGALLQAVGLEGAFWLSAATYSVSLAAIVVLRHAEELRPVTGNVMASLVEGFRHLAGNRTLTGVLAVTVIFNLFGFPFTSMIPVIGRDELRLSASLVGLVASTEGAGVLVGAVLMMLLAPVRLYRRFYFYGTCLYLITALVFSQSTWAPFAAAALFAVGLAGAAFGAMQSTLVMLCAAPAVRNRMMGVLSVCIGTGPVGFLHLGWMADALGAPAAVTVMALEGLLALVVVARIWPEVLAHQPAP